MTLSTPESGTLYQAICRGLMSGDEAIALVLQLRGEGVELRQRGRLLFIEIGEEVVGGPLRQLIAENWEQVALAVSADRATRRALAAACGKSLARC